MLPRCHGGPRPALSLATRPPGWGGLCSGGGNPVPSSGSDRAVPALHGTPDRTGRAGRAWQASCDVKPGGGGVGPSDPVLGLARTSGTAKAIHTLFPASKSLSKACSGPRSRSPAGRATQPSHRYESRPVASRAGIARTTDVLRVGELSCSACCRLEHLGVSPTIARPRVCSHDSFTAKLAPGQVTSEEPNGSSLG